jgi:hypothetical protein
MTLLKEKDYCEGNREKCKEPNCPLFGTLGRPARDGKRRIRGCNDPAARGKRNRSKGDSKARRARKALGIAGANSRHEEHWAGYLRLEVKAGAQVSPIATRFYAAENQSKQSKAVGDTRPFVMVAMPDETTDGIVLIRLSEFRTLLGALDLLK